ncbi:MAG: YbhB/YbcL family Raf kinase inhibitor-like protein [Steroidobacteraceae bacterium]
MIAKQFRIVAATVALATMAGAPLFAQTPPPARGPGLIPLTIESSAFPDGGVVPEKYAFRGTNTQPGFKFSNAPDNVQTYAIIFHDIDVAIGGNTDDVLHWVVWNIPGTTKEIPEGKLPEGSVNGKGIRNNEYMGPGAPFGPRYHHYVFEFYALNAKLDLPTTASRSELLEAMKGKVITKAAYVGRYKGLQAPAGAPAGGPPPAAR